MVQKQYSYKLFERYATTYACIATKPTEEEKNEKKADAKILFHHFSLKKQDILLTGFVFVASARPLSCKFGIVFA